MWSRVGARPVRPCWTRHRRPDVHRFGRGGAHFRRKFADDPHVIRVLELGGNNPLVVWDAADVEAVAGIVVQSAFITTGQRCSCARRLIVPEGPQGDAIIEAVAALVGSAGVRAVEQCDPSPMPGR